MIEMLKNVAKEVYDSDMPLKDKTDTLVALAYAINTLGAADND
jgi:hypothetical protein